MRNIYIKTILAGNGSPVYTEFAGRGDFYRYAVEWHPDFDLPAKASIDQICEFLTDSGPGHGARTHRRTTAKEYAKNAD